MPGRLRYARGRPTDVVTYLFPLAASTQMVFTKQNCLPWLCGDRGISRPWVRVRSLLPRPGLIRRIP